MNLLGTTKSQLKTVDKDYEAYNGKSQEEGDHPPVGLLFPHE
jgi:hypothetical protein